MKVAFTFISAILLAITADIKAQTPDGQWSGDLVLGQGKNLPLVLNIGTGSDGKPCCTLDSPMQGAEGIKTEVNVLTADSINITVPDIAATYAGRVTKNVITGRFTQMGMPFKLDLKRGGVMMNRPQTPQPPLGYTTQEVSFENKAAGAVLSGTLTWPEGYDGKKPVPVVIMVSGSGLQNRDEEVFGHKPFAVIADWLARNGVASLRYDDRGYGKSTGDGATATTEDFARDAHSAVKFMRETARFNRVGVLGHSEGATVAFMLGADSAADFIIAMGAQGVRGDSILIDQSETMLRDGGVPDEFIADYTEALRRLYEVKIAGGDMAAFASVDALCADWATDHIHNSLKENLRKIASEPNAWLRHFIGFSPAADIAATSCPVLVLYGEKDTQVRPGLNMPAVKRSAPAADVRLYPGLNHLMQHATTGSIAEYNTIEETISPEVLTDITAFVTAQ